MGTGMHKEIDGNYTIKRGLIISFSAFIFIFFVQGIVIGGYLKSLEEKQMIKYQNIVGGLKEKNILNDRELNEILFSENDEEKLRIGEEFFYKLGYGTNMGALDNELFYNEPTNLYLLIINIIFLSLFLCFLVLFFIFKKGASWILELSNDIQRITFKSGYKYRNDIGEGEIALLNTRLNKLNENIDKSINDIDKDRNMMKELINDLSHQIKTPITSLKLSNNFLKGNDLTEEEREEFINTSCKDIERLEWLSEGLMQVSRLEAGIVKLDIKPNNLKDTLIDGINGVYKKALKKGVNLEFNEFLNIVFRHDYRWTKEAIINILDNAIKYTESGGGVKVSLQEEKDLIKIVIEDSGIGIGEDEIFKVFKRFYRGRDIKVQRQEGSGLGLYLSRRIIEEEGGTIGLNSEVGKGSIFTITFYKGLLE